MQSNRKDYNVLHERMTEVMWSGMPMDIEDIHVTINGTGAVAQKQLEQGPPVSRQSAMYEWFIPSTENTVMNHRLELIRTRWSNDGMWYESMVMINPMDVQTDILVTCAIQLQSFDPYVNRLTFLWTDQMIRMQRLTKEWTFHETWMEWNRHAEVMDQGQSVQFQLSIPSGGQEEIMLRMYPLIKGKPPIARNALESLQHVRKSHENWVQSRMQIMTDDPAMNLRYVQGLKHIRGHLVEWNGQLIPIGSPATHDLDQLLHATELDRK